MAALQLTLDELLLDHLFGNGVFVGRAEIGLGSVLESDYADLPFEVALGDDAVADGNGHTIDDLGVGSEREEEKKEKRSGRSSPAETQRRRESAEFLCVKLSAVPLRLCVSAGEGWDRTVD